jgi:hypothetical protein
MHWLAVHAVVAAPAGGRPGTASGPFERVMPGGAIVAGRSRRVFS